MIAAKTFSYKEVDGNHWPDAYLGDALYYAINYANWSNNESDTVVSIDWEVPEGITGSDAHEGSGNAYIKLTTTQYGSFRVTCYITTTEGDREQVKAVPMILRVI